MSDHVTPEPDALGELLGPPTLPPDDRLRDRLRERSAGAVRWRRRRRQLVRVAVLAAFFAAGLWTGHRPAPTPPVPVVAERAARPLPESEMPALVLEWEALDGAQDRALRYRVAGDRYLAEEGDLASAVRCYGGALDAGTAADLDVSPDDNWLLMVIKDARKKEKRHAPHVD
jgi:hypothetical protein